MTSLIRAITHTSTAILFASSLVVTSQVFATEEDEPADAPTAVTHTMTKEEQEGKDLAFAKSKGNCLACHAIAGGNLAGNIGPALIAMKIRYPNKEDLFKVVWDPREKFGRGVIMPPFGDHKILTKEEIEKIVDYLYTL
ncbi:sulfur oxidation c-type cytochrome SoxX [Halothiobacillus diazotrophicus]|nr:sulfur oxidation c-type cytochrome SoxX [Halothiobacillus diazotrophicus]